MFSHILPLYLATVNYTLSFAQCQLQLVVFASISTYYCFVFVYFAQFTLPPSYIRLSLAFHLCHHLAFISLCNSGHLDSHIGSYILYKDIYRLNLYVKDLVNPVCCSLCPSVCYFPEIRSSVSLYIVQSLYRQIPLLVP